MINKYVFLFLVQNTNHRFICYLFSLELYFMSLPVTVYFLSLTIRVQKYINTEWNFYLLINNLVYTLVSEISNYFSFYSF